MKNQPNPSICCTEFNIELVYSDLDSANKIDRYYNNLLSDLKLNDWLSAEQMAGELTFLTQEWESELIPLVNLFSVSIYEPQIA